MLSNGCFRVINSVERNIYSSFQKSPAKMYEKAKSAYKDLSFKAYTNCGSGDVTLSPVTPRLAAEVGFKFKDAVACNLGQGEREASIFYNSSEGYREHAFAGMRRAFSGGGKSTVGDKGVSKAEMDALQFDPHKKTLSLLKTKIPAINEKDEVIVKVAYAGICGSDLHILGGSFPCRDGPLILGHEFCGVASSVGSEVKHVKSGDKVVVDPNSGCNTCTFCTSGRYQLCPTGGINSTIGIFRDGGWGQYCKVPAHQVHKLPDSITLEQAVLCEPISCLSYTWERVGPLPVGSSILVTGAGIIGNLFTCLCHFFGHRNVTVVEAFPVRRTLNQKLDTGYKCVSPEELQTMKTTNPEWGVDLCVDCSGNAQALQDGLSSLRAGGKLCIFGVANPNSRLSISPYEMFKKELTVLGVLTNPYSFPNAIGLIEAMGSRYLDFDKLGIKVFSLEQYQEAIEALKGGTISKAVFKHTSGPD